MAAQTTHGPDLDLTTALPVARRRLAPWTVVVAVVVGVGVLLRTYTASATWLDETLTINIASLPLSRIPAALRLDGAPPLYYLLLHGWMRVFGSSDVAARSLSGLCSIATLPLMWAAGRRAAGPGGARAALLLLAASPFAIYYATEARMYALVVLLVTAGYLLLQRALTRPSMARLWPVAVVAGALALTHYWALFLLTAVALLLVWRICRGSLPGERRAARRCLLALAAGGVLFLPWLPIFVFQARHTGTPWAQPAQYSALVHAVGEWAGGVSTAARILGLLFLLLAVVGLLGRRMDERRMVIDLAPDGEATALGWVFAGTIVIALTAGLVAGSGFDGRYTSVAFPPFLLLTVRGVRALPQHAARPVLVLAVVAGLATALGNPVNRLKTDADLVAAAIRPTAQPADLVIYCPDQLGPAVSRHLPAWLHQEVFPGGGAPARVNWVDYEQRNSAADPQAFADTVLRRAGPGSHVWLVYGTDYRTYEGKCDGLASALSVREATHLAVDAQVAYDEHPALVRFDIRAATR